MTTTLLPSVERGAGNPSLQAYGILLNALRNRVLPANGRLPSERALADQLGVSRATVRQVLTALAQTGLLRASPNRGWFVNANVLSEGPNILRSFTEDVRDRGFTPMSQVLVQRVRAATLDEAETLGLAPAAPILELDRLRGMDDVPVAVDQARLPMRAVPGLDSVNLNDCSLYLVLAERFHLVPTRCDYEVQAHAASELIADLLRLEPGAPVLVGSYTTYDDDERPILCGRTSFRGDAYRFKASLFRFEPNPRRIERPASQ
jgi:GntR family transcriptional regulator